MEAGRDFDNAVPVLAEDHNSSGDSLGLHSFEMVNHNLSQLVQLGMSEADFTLRRGRRAGSVGAKLRQQPGTGSVQPRELGVVAELLPHVGDDLAPDGNPGEVVEQPSIEVLRGRRTRRGIEASAAISAVIHFFSHETQCELEKGPQSVRGQQLVRMVKRQRGGKVALGPVSVKQRKQPRLGFARLNLKYSSEYTRRGWGAENPKSFSRS